MIDTVDKDDIEPAEALEIVESPNFKTAGNRAYAIFICVFASMGGIYFGYDQGVSGGMFNMRSFLDDFCVGKEENSTICTPDAAQQPDQYTTFITLYNVIYNIGCIFGGLSAGQVAERFGRRAAVFYAALCFNVGTAWVLSTQEGQFGVCLSGRVLEGMGVGASSFSAPLYAAENAPKEFRGALSGFMQMAVVTGLLISSAVNLKTQDLDEGWKISNAVILVPPFLMMCFVFCLPESPRWVYQYKGEELSKKELARVRKTDDIEIEFQAIREQVEAEVGNGKATYADCFSPTMRRRTLIAISMQILQQATGINPIFTYGALIFKAVTTNELVALLTLATVNFFSTMPSLYWVDRFGRRTMLLFGASGMILAHLGAATTFVLGCEELEDESVVCQGSSGEIMIAFAAVFIFFFACSWGPIGWIYPSEIFPLHVRTKCVSLSTAANWFMGAVMLAIVKIFPYLRIFGVFYLFAVLCVGCWLFVYFLCPETKGILLEDIEYVFSGLPIPEKKLKEDPLLAEDVKTAHHHQVGHDKVVEPASEVKEASGATEAGGGEASPVASYSLPPAAEAGSETETDVDVKDTI